MSGARLELAVMGAPARGSNVARAERVAEFVPNEWPNSCAIVRALRHSG